MKRFKLLSVVLLMVITVSAQNYKTECNISYTTKTDAYSKERLKLDVYFPENLKDCPVIVWFHGGGLEAGQKEIPQRLKEKGYVVIGANYRLLPKVTVDKTLDDAAEAVAWAFRNAKKYGGDPKKIVVTGHSAGGYLSMMLCLNKAWLNNYKIDADCVWQYIPFSGQAITHYNVRKMQGIKPFFRAETIISLIHVDKLFCIGQV